MVVVNTSKVTSLSKKLKSQAKTIVLVGGCFDILHIGHTTFLEKAKKRGDILVVILEGDENIKLRKGKDKPIHPQEQRAQVLASLKAVDYVILLPFMEKDSDYDLLIKKISPQVIAITKGDPGIVHKKRTAKLAGAKIKVVTKLVGNHSTGNIINKIKSI